MTTTDLTHVAREAADWLDTHEWVQGQWGDDTKGCLHQAVRVCDPQPGDGYLVSAVLTAQGHGTEWNDAEGRTRDEVLDLLRSVSVTDAELAATFGPNWLDVVDVVRKAAGLTSEQVERLAAGWDAAWYAARDAAHSTNSRSAARSAAWYAARDAAVASVSRDLITAEHYETLTGPWVSVMGPIGGAR